MLRGEEWKEKRAEITPAFTPNRVSHSVVYRLFDLGRTQLFTVDQSFVPTR